MLTNIACNNPITMSYLLAAFSLRVYHITGLFIFLKSKASKNSLKNHGPTTKIIVHMQVRNKTFEIQFIRKMCALNIIRYMVVSLLWP